MATNPKSMPPDTILVVIHDGHNMHCLTEADLDEWYRSLSSHQKTKLYELETEGLLDSIPSPYAPEPQSLEEHTARFMREALRDVAQPYYLDEGNDEL